MIAEIKELACSLPATSVVPLSRWSASELAAELVTREVVASISPSTVWRVLDRDAIRPWFHQSWIFPRDPNFAAKASVVLDLDARSFGGSPLSADEYVICADEKTSIQCRCRRHPTSPPGKASIRRLQMAWPNLRLIHLPVHASWLNQCEIYFSIVQRKVVNPNGFTTLDQISERLATFETRYNQRAVPFGWTFGRDDLDKFCHRLDEHRAAA